MTIEQAVMRTSLAATLLGALARNQKRGVADVRLFEIGRVFLRAAPGAAAGAPPDEPLHAAGIVAGRRPGWLVPDGEIDFFDVRAAVESLAAEIAPTVAVRFRPASVAWLHPGVAAEIELDGHPVGVVGEVHPATRRAFEIDGACFAFEVDLGRFPAVLPRQMRPIPRYPSTSRDLSFLVDASEPAGRIRDLLLAGDDPLVEGVALLEDYRDPAHVPAGKKGMLWSVTYRSYERTLTDEEVEARHEERVSRVLSELGATRR
jgi:phenylalanyl-tRNA synthetase beta chain